MLNQDCWFLVMNFKWSFNSWNPETRFYCAGTSTIQNTGGGCWRRWASGRIGEAFYRSWRWLRFQWKRRIRRQQKIKDEKKCEQKGQAACSVAFYNLLCRFEWNSCSATAKNTKAKKDKQKKKDKKETKSKKEKKDSKNEQENKETDAKDLAKRAKKAGFLAHVSKFPLYHFSCKVGLVFNC